MTDYSQRMAAEERQKRILEILSQKGEVIVSDLSAELSVSTVTIRTDLTELEHEGKLKRIHGGAVPMRELVVPSLPTRIRRNVRAKDAIGLAAAELVHDGETILVGSGSTTLALIRSLDKKKDVSVISDEPAALNYIQQHLPNTTPISTGGILGRGFHLYGPYLTASLVGTHVDKVFLGADGFERRLGFLAERQVTAGAKKEFMKHASKVIILMDATKVGASRLFVPFAQPGNVDLVIMDTDPSDVVAEAARVDGGRARVVEVVRQTAGL